MKKIFRFVGVLLLLLVSMAVAIKTASLYVPVDELKSYAAIDKFKSLFKKSTPAPSPSQAVVPDLQVLMQQATAQDLSIQTQEEKQLIAQQVAAAKKDITSKDAQQRYVGAQQLSAYQTPESEKLLIKALSDKEQTVRRAAVESLSTFKTLSNPAISALLATINDKNPEIQVSTITTLQTQLNNEPAGSERYQIIMHGLQKAESARNLSAEVRQGLHDFIEEQQSIVGVNPPLPLQDTEKSTVIE